MFAYLEVDITKFEDVIDFPTKNASFSRVDMHTMLFISYLANQSSCRQFAHAALLFKSRSRESLTRAAGVFSALLRDAAATAALSSAAVAAWRPVKTAQ